VHPRRQERGLVAGLAVEGDQPPLRERNAVAAHEQPRLVLVDDAQPEPQDDRGRDEERRGDRLGELQRRERQDRVHRSLRPGHRPGPIALNCIGLASAESRLERRIRGSRGGAGNAITHAHD
jgi:hypothetical protein